jgi:acyl-coenzyme A thioesterase PaaI-like protein
VSEAEYHSLCSEYISAKYWLAPISLSRIKFFAVVLLHRYVVAGCKAPRVLSDILTNTKVVIHNRSRHRARQLLNFFAISTVSFAVGAYLAIQYSPPLLAPWIMGSLPTDEETLSMFEAPDEYSRGVDDHIRNCSIAKELRAHPDFREARPHLKIPEAVRSHNLTGGILSGPGMIVVPPYIWNEKDGKEMVSIFYVGNNVSGHPGMVHGGLLATMLDEGLARCCFPALPNKVAVTANLQINYKKPTKTDQYLVLKAKTIKVEGRKAFVEGHIETMPENGEEPETLVTANALFIEPKHASVSAIATMSCDVC